GGIGAESDTISAPRRISVRGADVGGIELSMAPLASLSGRVIIDSKAAACQKRRASTVEEILLAAERDENKSRAPSLISRLTATRPAAPKMTGEFILRNLEAGRRRVITQLPDENWYVRAISMEGKPPAPAARRTTAPAPAPINIGRNGVTI